MDDDFTVKTEGTNADIDLSDMLVELRILLPGAQLLTAFLITLPFNSGFGQIIQFEKIVFMVTFFCSISSLILFTGPAIQHRLMRPLLDRQRFKNSATRQMVAGTICLTLALVLSANLVMSEVFGQRMGITVAVTMATFIGAMWWIWPIYARRRLSHHATSTKRIL
ncbi:DUF6328 family protein [Noviherbaspirillum sp. 1P10PC]|uniref:DUF6328 family protein n=1 Tax=Noviherbaspirillum sp. 1P10PC TaxID=3132292 RepID=UPI00399FACBF